MAINRTKKEEKKEEKKNDVTYDINVTRIKVWDNGNITFDAIVNGISIYGMNYITVKKDGAERSFVSFPQRKGADGKYYNYCYFKIDDELLAIIEKQIEEKLASE